jgi:hypothetical protein
LTSRWTIVIAAAAMATACQQDSNSGSTPEAEASAPVPVIETPVAPVAALLMADDSVFELALPQGALPDGGAGGTQHFRINAEFDDLLAFYEEALPDGYVLTRYERGARFEAPDGAGRSVYLYRERGQGWLITYFDAGADPSLAAAENTPEQTAPSADGTTPGGRPGSVGDGAGSSQGGDSTTVAAGGSESAPSGRRPGSDAPQARALPRTPSELDDRVGAPYQGDPDTYVPDRGGVPEVVPRVHPRVEALIRSGEVGTGNRRSLDFTRGVRESRRNPDAMF